MPAKRAFGSRSWLGGQAAKPNDLLGIALARPELYEQALYDYLRVATEHFGNMTALCEETSVYDNRIELDSSQEDAYSLPAAKAVNNIPKENVARLDLAKREGLEVFRAAGASEVWASARNAEHLVGGTLMGEDTASSVTNSYGQTHELDNLFVTGASLFPTVAAVNPTATLASLALRTAEYTRHNRAALLKSGKQTMTSKMSFLAFAFAWGLGLTGAHLALATDPTHPAAAEADMAAHPIDDIDRVPLGFSLDVLQQGHESFIRICRVRLPGQSSDKLRNFVWR